MRQITKLSQKVSNEILCRQMKGDVLWETIYKQQALDFWKNILYRYKKTVLKCILSSDLKSVLRKVQRALRTR